jgi:hypothetical protein
MTLLLGEFKPFGGQKAPAWDHKTESAVSLGESTGLEAI